MKVKIFSFEWNLEIPELDLKTFLSFLKTASGTQQEDNPHVLAISEKSGYYVGVLLTVKDSKRFTQMIHNPKGFVVTAEELSAGRSFVDVNFFIINPNTGRGLYQYYHHSASVNLFCAICKSFYRQLKKSHGIHKRGSLKYSIITRPENFLHYAQKLSGIKSIELEQVSYTFNENDFKPVALQADRIVERAVFIRPWKQREALKSVVNYLRRSIGNLKRATIKGIDPEGQEAIYKLFNDYDVLEEYEYDDFVQSITLDGNDLEGSIQKASNIESLLALSQKPNIKILLESQAKK
jgi:hypothetical protein